MSKKVSVIIPCFNATKWLPKCFLSLVQQTIGIENIELIFVDDASTDNGETWNMLQEFECAYPESILILKLEENMRQGGARNIALQYATGEYIAFVDSDDFVTSDFLQVVYKAALEYNADFVQFEYCYYTENLGAVSSNRTISPEVINITSSIERKQLLVSEKITYGCWNKLYRRSLIELANVSYAEHTIYEEPLFVYPLLFYANKIIILDNVLYFYRQNNTGTMRHDMEQENTLKMHENVQLAVWNFMKRSPFFREYYEEIKLYFLHTYLYETIYFGKLRNFKISLSFFKQLEATVLKEVSDYNISIYSDLIPMQMKLYKKLGHDIDKFWLDNYIEQL